MCVRRARTDKNEAGTSPTETGSVGSRRGKTNRSRPSTLDRPPRRSGPPGRTSA
ncbi:hypothetical protein JYU34_009939 [Plutella xylostella]|uniref:Uncharacterized protein n=1 Tax=Plutella xylostella TaxID=51655 RepID=A0ABQ7QL70_PLUXY|nr:hypothetical protein JYU34_009939 [Plutella xylostella]